MWEASLSSCLAELQGDGGLDLSSGNVLSKLKGGVDVDETELLLP